MTCVVYIVVVVVVVVVVHVVGFWLLCLVSFGAPVTMWMYIGVVTLGLVY